MNDGQRSPAMIGDGESLVAQIQRSVMSVQDTHAILPWEFTAVGVVEGDQSNDCPI